MVGRHLYGGEEELTSLSEIFGPGRVAVSSPRNRQLGRRKSFYSTPLLLQETAPVSQLLTAHCCTGLLVFFFFLVDSLSALINSLNKTTAIMIHPRCELEEPTRTLHQLL